MLLINPKMLQLKDTSQFQGVKYAKNVLELMKDGNKIDESDFSFHHELRQLKIKSRRQQARPSIFLSYINDFPDPLGSSNGLLLQVGQIWKISMDCAFHNNVP